MQRRRFGIPSAFLYISAIVLGLVGMTPDFLVATVVFVLVTMLFWVTVSK